MCVVCVVHSVKEWLYFLIMSVFLHACVNVGPTNTQHILCVVLRCIPTIGRKGQAGEEES